ncbi:hypothetical protein NX059_011075 [Plenodomus lindquistii]|nr:hypothetical protein NX059_011075 [Plenodomus lindquistii]
MLTECSVAPMGYFNTFYTACFKNDARIVTKAVELHDAFIATLQAHIPAGDFISQCLFQPLPLLFARQSASQGIPNIMGLNRQIDNGLILTVSVMIKNQADSVFAGPKIKAWVQTLQAFAEQIGGNQAWVYANYADTSQDPLASYGQENVAFLKEVARRYDPEGIFQRRCPGGFKIPGVGDGEETGR